MKIYLPIPIEDIKKGELSDEIRKKLRESELNKIDIDVSKAIYEVAKEKNLEEIGFEKAIEINDLIIITTKQKVGLLIGKGGSIAGALSKKLNKKIRIIKFAEDKHRTVADLIKPATLKGINIKYTKEGKVLKVRIDNKQKLPMDEPTLIIALTQFLGAKIELA